MAGVAGNNAWLMLAPQTAKGTPATPAIANTFKVPFAGGNVSANRETDRLEETDASRDQGTLYVQQTSVEGDPEVYVRDESIVLPLWAALGSIASVATPPNSVHTVTPGNTLPWLTAWKSIGDLLWERYDDCKVGSLEIQAEAGNPLQATVGLRGRKTTRLTADPSVGPPLIVVQNAPVYTYNEASVTLGGVATSAIRSFDLTIENNADVQQTDDVQPYDVTVGTREISLGFDLIFEDLTEYNKFYFGGPAGTQVATDIYTTSATFTFSKGTDNEIAFNLPQIAYEEFPVEPDAGGDPIVVSVRAGGLRGGSPIVTSTVKNQHTSYAAV